MSTAHPIIAVTGSSGAGTTTVRHAFSDIFRREQINAAFVEGDSFFRYTAAESAEIIRKSTAAGSPVTRFGPDANLFDKLEGTFREYGKTGMAKTRRYIKSGEDTEQSLKDGTFTPWRNLPANTDLLFYEGMHGGVVASTWTRRRMSPSHNPKIIAERRKPHEKKSNDIDVAQHVDLLLGVVPAVNLEWIQKIHRDCSRTGCTVEAVTATILRRMHDYVHFIVPQFSLTDINFQRIPMVDTSNPFIAHDVPTLDESMVVIRFREPKKYDFPYYLRNIDGAFMSRPNTMVVPGGKMSLAMEVVCTPIIHDMMARKRKSRG
jgi:phosphoribulokinase